MFTLTVLAPPEDVPILRRLLDAEPLLREASEDEVRGLGELDRAQVLGQLHVIVAEENHMRAGLGPPDEMRPFLNQGLPRLVCRMGLARKDELHRTLRMG